MKLLSVPRLELLGCLLLSKLVKEVVLAVSSRVCVSRIFCWTDSELVLCSFKGKEKCWNGNNTIINNLRSSVRKKGLCKEDILQFN